MFGTSNGFASVIIADNYLESRAIGRYIASKYSRLGESLMPEGEDSRSIALFEEAASIELTHFDHFAQPLVLKKIIARSVI
jgi:glutathione S-transferase